MAKCSNCGKSVSFFSNICSECKQAAEAQQREEHMKLLAERAKISAEVQREFEKLQEEAVKAKSLFLIQKIKNGNKVFFYESVYLPVDSKVVDIASADDFKLSALIRFGYSGWNIVAVVPRTLGIALTNTTYSTHGGGETWGAGVGGNILGVYIIVSKEITSQTEDIENLTEDYVRRNLFDFLSESEVDKFTALLNATL